LRTASTRRRRREGSTCSSFASAVSDVSSTPSLQVATAPQSDRDGDGLVVVEQQRGHRRPGGQPIPARDAGARVHGIAERPQLTDVGAHRPRTHAQPIGELGARQVALELEQRQQLEQAGRGLQHVLDHSS
jgi:hypothetical protein